MPWQRLDSRAFSSSTPRDGCHTNVQCLQSCPGFRIYPRSCTLNPADLPWCPPEHSIQPLMALESRQHEHDESVTGVPTTSAWTLTARPGSHACRHVASLET